MTTKLSARAKVAKIMDANVRSFANYLDNAKGLFLGAESQRFAEAAKVAELAAKEAAKVAKNSKTDEAKEAAKVAELAAKEAAKVAALAKQIAASAPISVATASEMISGTNLKYEDFTPKFLKEWLPSAYNKEGKLCDFRKVKPEDEEAALKDSNRDVFERDGILVERVPVILWTGNKLLQKFCAAAKERKEAARYASQMEREAARAAKRKAVEDGILAKAAAIIAKRESAQKDSQRLETMKEEAAK